MYFRQDKIGYLIYLILSCYAFVRKVKLHAPHCSVFYARLRSILLISSAEQNLAGIATEDNKKLDISFLLSARKGKSYYDTENIEIEQFVFKESNVYIWQIDEMTYLILSQDDVECHISASCAALYPEVYINAKSPSGSISRTMYLEVGK